MPVYKNKENGTWFQRRLLARFLSEGLGVVSQSDGYSIDKLSIYV